MMGDKIKEMMQRVGIKEEHIYPFICIALIMINLLFFVTPLALHLYKNHTHIAQLVRDVHNAQEGQSNSAKREHMLERATLNLADAESRLYSGNLETHLERIAEYAQTTGVQLKSLKPVQPEKLKTRKRSKTIEKDKPRIYQFQLFELEAVSGYHQVGQFIAAMESDDLYMRIRELSIRQGKATPGKHQISLTVEMWERNRELAT